MSGADDLWRYLREPSKGTPATPYQPEPEDHRLRTIVAAWERHADSFLGPSLLPGAIRAEVRLAELEGRTPRDFAIAQVSGPSPPPLHPAPAPPQAPAPTIEGDFRVETESEPTRFEEEPPPREGDDLKW